MILLEVEVEVEVEMILLEEVEVEHLQVGQEILHQLVHHKEIMVEQELQIQDMDKAEVEAELRL